MSNLKFVWLPGTGKLMNVSDIVRFETTIHGVVSVHWKEFTFDGEASASTGSPYSIDDIIEFLNSDKTVLEPE